MEGVRVMPQFESSGPDKQSELLHKAHLKFLRIVFSF